MLNDRETGPLLTVGILSAPSITCTLRGDYTLNNAPIKGSLKISMAPGGQIELNGDTHSELNFISRSEDCSFELDDVTIGVNFHWQRKERQRFRGDLRVIGGDLLTAINVLPLESYLESVISSEMSASANGEFLRAHAVISRSWLLTQIRKRDTLGGNTPDHFAMTETDSERIRWYDREDHTLFDVCADDHCQRYQGISRQTTPTVLEAVEATRGLILTDENGDICDARFSKCCGGVFEEFENCWEPRHFHYLEARADNPDQEHFPDLTVEENAVRWITDEPEAFCNTRDKEILSQVLNNYDQETTDFYRWTVDYSNDELSALIKRRSGIDFGKIRALVPLQRGTSGRIVRLRIDGTKRSMTIGKELEIRRSLSTSHLYSSAFVVEPGRTGGDGLPVSFRLRGAGWGHGVGLCQIGAAVMSAQGYSYKQILAHYFPGATIEKIY